MYGGGGGGVRQFVSSSDCYNAAATPAATSEATPMDSSQSVDIFTTNFFENPPRTHQEVLEPKMAGTYVRYPYLAFHSNRALRYQQARPHELIPVPVTYRFHGFPHGVISLDHI